MPMTRFRVGTVLSTGWRVWKRNVVPFTLISLLIYVPSLVLHSEVKQDV